jgi:hypothetical protein
MCDDADLPDHDYEALYGRAALCHRRRTAFQATLRRLDALTAHLAAMTRQWDAQQRARAQPDDRPAP